ncbi:MAG: enoyl-CoA hydratase/isomerase family protein [Candidatus Phosphoribacter sp.]|nr:enoyl-CoA hydratase/isomerase family protein [Actinomycetales bacterium]
MPHPAIRVEHEEAVCTVTLCNPEHLNAQVPSMWLALAQIAHSLPEKIRVVVLAAEGRSFSAGLNRGMLRPGGIDSEPDLLAAAAQSPEAMTSLIGPFQEGFAVWRRIAPIVVAAVQGHAIGAGFQLALAADLRIVSEDVKFAMREVSLGMIPDLAGTLPLVEAVGYPRALEICATGRFVGAQEAVASGLASVAVPAEHLTAATADLVAALLAAPAPALRALKPLLHAALSATSEEQTRHERVAQGHLLHGMARAAGVTA